MPLLEVAGLSVRRNGNLALDGVGLSCGRGEVVGLIGPNGAGKTTLLDAVCGFLPMVAGSARLRDRELAGESPERRARAGLGRTFQQPRLVPDHSVLQALLTGCQARMRSGMLSDMLGLPASRREERLATREAARVAGLVGLDGELGRAIGTLPLGVLRLVDIGRALCGAPAVLLLDEAMSGMTRSSAAALAATVRRLADDEGLAALVVEHDVELVLSVCDFVYVLDAGRLIARGTPARVRSHPAVLEAYLGAPGTPEDADAAVGV